MKQYSQKNLRWKWQKLGTCNTTIGKAGCFVTSLANLADTELKDPKGKVREANPSIVDWVATVKGLYAHRCLVVSKTFAKLLNLEYKGKSSKKPSYPCIMETDHYAYCNICQHFCVSFPDGDIIDSLDWKPKKKKNPYNVVSYRLFRNKKNDCKDERKKVVKYERKLKEAQKEYNKCLTK